MTIRGWASAMALGVSFVAATPAWSQTLYSFGPDGFGTGRVFTSLDSSSPAQALGDGSVAFNGGLAFSASDSRFFAIENDSFGQSYLTSFTAQNPTNLSAATSLGTGFLGGLAANSNTSKLYAIANDSFGNSTFYGVGSTGATALGAIGSGFYGGLAFDSADGSFYAISAGDDFVQHRLSRIQLTASGPTVTTLFDLGDDGVSFNGGLTYDAAHSRFLVIGSDGTGDSSLYAFTLAGAGTLATEQSIGLGFVNAGLAYGPVAAVPEPSTAVLAVFGGAVVLLIRRRRAPPSTSA